MKQNEINTDRLIWANAKIAREFLKLSPGNRNESKAKIQEFACTMINGKWHRGDSPLMTDTLGRFRNGHTRMKAVILADLTQPGILVPFILREGVTEEELMSVDTGISRNLAAAAVFNPAYGFVDGRREQIANICLTNGYRYNNTQINLGNDAKAHWLENHRDSVDTVLNDYFAGKRGWGVTAPIILSVFVLADICGVDKDKLRYAARYLREDHTYLEAHTSLVDSSQKETLKLLKSHITNNSNRVKSWGTSTARRDVYLRTQHMLHCFLVGEVRQKVTKSSEEYFKCEDFERLPVYKIIDNDFLESMVKVTTLLSDGIVVRPIDIGELLIKAGHTTRYKNAAKSLGSQFAKMVKNTDGVLTVGEGKFYALDHNGDKQFRKESKVMKYQFLKEESDAPTTIKKVFFDEDDFIHQIRKKVI